MYNFFVRLMASFIFVPSWRRKFRKKFLKQTDKQIDILNRKLDATNQKLDWITNFVKQTTDITKVPPAHGDLRLVQRGSAKLLHIIHEICEQNGLKYWMGYGTLIGVLRHGGYIPWDDDIDIAMMREDYDKLMQILGDGKYQNTNGAITFNLADICKVFYKDSPARVDIFPFDQYYKVATSDEDIAELHKNLTLAHNAIIWDWKKTEKFWPDVIPTSPQTYAERMDIIRNVVMQNKKPVKNGTIFRGADVWGLDDSLRPLSPDMIFPLRTAQFDGYTVYIPNKAHEILANIYGDIYQWPNDMFPHHELLRCATREQLNKIYQLLDCDMATLVKDISKK